MRLSKETYQRLLNKSISVKQNKYHNVKCQLDGIKFDSKKEMYRWIQLKQLEDIGQIKNLKRQVRYELQPSFELNGSKIRAITYIADFEYEKDNQIIVEDTKSEATKKDKTYMLKKKMFMYRYKKEIKEV